MGFNRVTFLYLIHILTVRFKKGVAMSKFYRYRLPPWLIRLIILIERAIVPIVIFQSIRTLLFLSAIDVVILILLIALFIAFYLEWL